GQHRQRAYDLLRAGDERSSRIRKTWASAVERNPLGQKPWIFAGVVDEQRSAFFKCPMTAGTGARLLDSLEAIARLEPKTVVICPSDVGVICPTENRGELDKLIKCRIRIAVENTEFGMRKRIRGFKPLGALHRKHSYTQMR